MKVKCFDFEHEKDLENAINNFIKDKEVEYIQYQTSHFAYGNEQIFSFSALVAYKNDEIDKK